MDRIIQAAVAEEDAFVCAFGQRWGPENVRDKIFGFLPGNGIHDIHMNQGNSGSFARDNGVWQDGGLLVFFPSTGKWSAIFLKFQSQTWHTDDRTGDPITPDVVPPRPTSDFDVRIIAALVNPVGPDQGKETVMLLNVSDADVDLSRWHIANRNKDKAPLAGVIKSGQVMQFTLPVQVPLGNDGGIITLLDAAGLKIDGASYTKAQVSRQGWTVAF